MVWRTSISWLDVWKDQQLRLWKINLFMYFPIPSKDADAALMYERNIYQDGSLSVSFIVSNSKVALLNTHKTPRLELPSATLGLDLWKVVPKVLRNHVMRNSVFWCASMNVLYWTKNTIRKFKSLAANRIGEIHKAAEPTQCNFVNGRINPANFGSQGMDLVLLSGCSTYWNGPEFLLWN